MTAQFIPDVSYADVLFGENAASLKAKGFIENPERYLPEVGLVVLERDSLSVYLRDDAVESISSDAEFWYRDVNLVGADLATATKVLGKATARRTRWWWMKTSRRNRFMTMKMTACSFGLLASAW